MSEPHRLEAAPSTVHWGYFDADLPPVLEVKSGDEVVLSSLSGDASVLPGPGFMVPQALLDIHQQVPKKLPGHLLTGPVRVSGAKAGQVLQVDILDVRPTLDWGYTYCSPLKGALAYDDIEDTLVHTRLDAADGTGTLPWGLSLPLSPFFGVMGVAPPPSWGMISSIQPRAHGGNLDNKELVAGTTLYLPIHVDGALFSAGDGHGCQGDGEVCVTAIETALEGRFRLTVRDDMSLTIPHAETDSHFMTMGFDEDLDDAARIALREMIALIRGRTNLSQEHAYILCSLACDLRVTQIVNGEKGIHAMLPKSVLA